MYRFHPKILRFSTDLLSASNQKNFWPKIYQHEHFENIHQIVVDDAFLSSNFFCSISHDLSYHRMLKTEDLLQKITFIVTDENLKIVKFPKMTNILIQCTITPNSDID